jgi:hypothetical protein
MFDESIIDTDPEPVNSVPLRYYCKVLRELRAEGQFKAMRVMMENAWFSDERAWWVREAI